MCKELQWLLSEWDLLPVFGSMSLFWDNVFGWSESFGADVNCSDGMQVCNVDRVKSFSIDRWLQQFSEQKPFTLSLHLTVFSNCLNKQIFQQNCVINRTCSVDTYKLYLSPTDSKSSSVWTHCSLFDNQFIDLMTFTNQSNKTHFIRSFLFQFNTFCKMA